MHMECVRTCAHIERTAPSINECASVKIYCNKLKYEWGQERWRDLCFVCFGRGGALMFARRRFENISVNGVMALAYIRVNSSELSINVNEFVYVCLRILNLPRSNYCLDTQPSGRACNHFV